MCSVYGTLDFGDLTHTYEWLPKKWEWMKSLEEKRKLQFIKLDAYPGCLDKENSKAFQI